MSALFLNGDSGCYFVVGGNQWDSCIFRILSAKVYENRIAVNAPSPRDLSSWLSCIGGGLSRLETAASLLRFCRRGFVPDTVTDGVARVLMLSDKSTPATQSTFA